MVKMFSLQILLFGTAFICSIDWITANEHKIVETINGPVRGVRGTTLLKNVTYYSFKGIPYAKPPTGELRFKPPEPADSWAPTILDAFEYSSVCVQPLIFLPRSLPQSEDCLTLNIYVPADIVSDDKLAVLFFIHGGGFIGGSSDDALFGPDFIIEKQTILVTPNYRLGVLGFLSLNTVEYSGNMGLKDQQLALKWISENINRFGGDNKRITVFGHSAGAASTHFQVLSAESRKYFRNSISMSGTVNDYWAISEYDHLKRAFNIAKELGQPKDTVEELIEFLKSVPADKLASFAVLDLLAGSLFAIPTAPIIEKKDAKRPFLTESPKEIYESTKIETDTWFTMTSKEMISLYPKPTPSALNKLDANFNLPLPFKGFNLPMDSEEHFELNKAIRTFYFGDTTIDEETLSKYYDYLSDINFVYGIDKSVKEHATHSKSKTYYAWFDVDSTLNVFKQLDIFKRSEMANLSGAAHGDEICYLFRCGVAQKLYDEIISDKDDEHSKISHQTIDYVTTLFTNFAKYGKPTYQNVPIEGFHPVQMNNIHFLNISNGGLTNDLQPRKEAFNFWANIEQSAFKMSMNKNGQQKDEL